MKIVSHQSIAINKGKNMVRKKNLNWIMQKKMKNCFKKLIWTKARMVNKYFKCLFWWIRGDCLES